MKSTAKKSASSRRKKNNRWSRLQGLSRLRILVFVFIFGVIGSILLFRSFAATDTPAYRKLGLFQNNLTQTSAATYEKWLGRNVDTVLQFFGSDVPDKVTGITPPPFTAIDSATWWCTPWAGSRYHQVVSLAILPRDGVSLKEGANGAYNAHWVKFAQNAVNKGCGDVTLRLGWEFNGGFYNWTIWPEKGGSATDYAAYYRNIVNSIRSVPGANFTFDWCPLAGKVTSTVTQSVVEQAYPGDAYVDYIGLDTYDGSSKYYNATSKDYASAWNERLTQPLGLNWQKAFALSHNKPVTYPEWGVTKRANDDTGGGDNPTFIQNMYNWFNGLPSSGGASLAYAVYFDVHAQDGDHQLSPTTAFPNSSAKFQSLFGGSVTSAGDTVAPTVSLTAPTNSSTVTGPVGVTAGASDNTGVSKVTISIDSSVVATDTTAPYSYTWDTTGTVDGTHTVSATAYDAAGNRATASNTVTVQNAAPSPSLQSSDLVVTNITTSPAPPTTGSAVKFSATIKNQGTAPTPSNVKMGVVFRVDGGITSWSDTNYSSLAAGASITLTANGGPTGSATWSATAGSHTVEAFVDNANLITESNETNNKSTATFNVADIASGSGLLGQYYNNKDLTSFVLSRTDKTVNFNWSKGSPASGIGVDTFSARWTGFVLPPATNTYTFYVKSDDGVRLWVNDKLLVDNWVNQSAKEKSATISLSGGQKYSVKIEYYENTRTALMQFLWSSPSISKQIVPMSQLYPN